MSEIWPGRANKGGLKVGFCRLAAADFLLTGGNSSPMFKSISQSHHLCLSHTCNSVLLKHRSSPFRPEWGFCHAAAGTLVLRLQKAVHRNKTLRSESCDALLRCI